MERVDALSGRCFIYASKPDVGTKQTNHSIVSSWTVCTRLIWTLIFFGFILKVPYSYSAPIEGGHNDPPGTRVLTFAKCSDL